MIFLLGFYQNAFSLSQDFSRKFALNMHEDLPKILDEIKQITDQILKMESSKRWNAVDLLNATNVFGYEIVVRMNSRCTQDGIGKISGYFEKPRPVLCERIINDLGVLFKNLVILFPYWESSKQIIFECQQIFHDITNINPLFQKSRTNKNIDRLFIYYLPRLLIIINYNLSTKIPFDFNKMHAFSKITAEKDMGSITRDLKNQREDFIKNIQKQKDEQISKIKEEADKREAVKLPKFVQKGIELINELTAKIPGLMLKDSTAMMLEENEKMLELYFLFKEFDENYSFIMTSSQVKLSPIMTDGVRVDIKSNLEKHYMLFSEILSGIKEYTKLMEQFNKLKEDFADSPFVLQQKIKELEKKRVHSFFEIKGKASTLFKNLSAEIQTLIIDYKGEKRLLQNGESVLHFEVGKGGKKNRFENISVINALIYILSYCSALFFYLTNGRLGEGGGLYFADIADKKDEAKKQENIKAESTASGKKEDKDIPMQ